MQLAVSIAVVLVALSVVTDSASVSVVEEPTLSQKFERFQGEVQTFFDGIGEKAKGAFRDLHNSEISTKARNWFTENFQKLKEKFKKTFSPEETN
ncbi:UNVERIFIED_CONTAM: hypothetical protein K2H54_032717 [Gekko kuhli]